MEEQEPSYKRLIQSSHSPVLSIEDVGPDKLSFPSMENEIEENYQGDAFSQGSKRRASEAGVNDDSKAYAKKKREKTSPVWAQFEQLPIDESTGDKSVECKICRTVLSQE
ncbi:hypothetical protein Droror1_Dr00008873 [Drosera rotundifolia]